jgi:hypothetical protein
MIRIGKEAGRLSRCLADQRLQALQRIIPLSQVTAALREAGGGRTFCCRTPDAFMIWFVIALGLFCADAYRQVYRWLVRWKKGDVPGRSTLCEARQRLGVFPLVCLARSVVQLLGSPTVPGCYYQGLRRRAIDGFKLTVPDTPALDRTFGRQRNGRGQAGYPQVKVVGLVEAGTHVFWKWLIKDCHHDESKAAGPLLKHLQPDMLLLWDRGFASFELVRQVVVRGAQLLARWKANRILVPIRRLRDGSYIAKIYAHESDRKADRTGIEVRIIDYTLKTQKKQEKHRLLTTLLDARMHPARTLVDEYHQRWEEELAVDEFKTHEMERVVLRSQTPAGVVQEIYGLMLAHYVLRALMVEAARQADSSPVRLSFTGTLKILRCRLPEYPATDPAKNQWWKRLLEELQEEMIPPRSPRINPRVIKRPQSQWPTKRPHHRKPPLPAMPFLRSVVILR